MSKIFLGQPPANVKAWIVEHYATSTGHPETRFTLQGGTVETHSITGTLTQQWMSNNGYFDENEWTWLKTITQADIGNTITSIRESAFWGCSSLISVTIPDSVENISPAVFYNCSGLTSVTIPDSVTSIGDYAFSGCSSLTSMTIPDNVKNIEQSAFQNCTSITSVTIVATGKPGASAASVKDKMIAAGVSSNITWNMP